MKKSVVIKAKRIKPLKWDYQTVVLFTLFLCGVILGVLIIKNGSEELKDLLNNCMRNYISTKNKSGFLMCFSGIVAVLLLFVFLDFLLGLCAVGTPLVWTIPIIFGIVCGCCVSCMLNIYGLKGLLYCILVDLLCYAITAATLIKCCCESTKMSVDLFMSIVGNNYKTNCLFKEYSINYLVLCIPIIIAALLNTACFKIFAGLFIFA